MGQIPTTLDLSRQDAQLARPCHLSFLLLGTKPP